MGEERMGTSISYRSLSDEQKAVLQTKVIDAAKTPQEWQRFLQPIAAYDRKRDRSSGRAKGFAVAGGLLMFFSIFALIFSEMEFGKSGLLGGAVILVLAVLRYRSLRSVNIEGDLNKIVVPVLHILQEELPAQEKLHLHLNLCELEKAELVKEVRPKNKSSYPRVTTKLFRKSWFVGATRLADGTTLRLRITDLVKKIEKTKRNPRGKIKTKQKYKQQCVLSLAMGFRSEAYAVRTSRLHPQGKVAIKSRDRRHWIKLQRRVKFPPRTTTEPDSIPLDDVIGTIAAAFQQVAPIRKTQ